VRDRELRCAICRTEMPFETPPCVDGHEDDCPELLCTRCGANREIYILTDYRAGSA